MGRKFPRKKLRTALHRPRSSLWGGQERERLWPAGSWTTRGRPPAAPSPPSTAALVPGTGLAAWETQLPHPPSLRRADPSTQLIPAFQPGLPAQPPDVFSAPTSHRVGAGRPGTPAPAEAAGPAPRSPQAWWLWLWRMSKSRPLLLAGAQPGLPAYSGQPKSRFEVRPPEGM